MDYKISLYTLLIYFIRKIIFKGTKLIISNILDTKLITTINIKNFWWNICVKKSIYLIYNLDLLKIKPYYLIYILYISIFINFSFNVYSFFVEANYVLSMFFIFKTKSSFNKNLYFYLVDISKKIKIYKYVPNFIVEISLQKQYSIKKILLKPLRAVLITLVVNSLFTNKKNIKKQFTIKNCYIPWLFKIKVNTFITKKIFYKVLILDYPFLKQRNFYKWSYIYIFNNIKLFIKSKHRKWLYNVYKVAYFYIFTKVIYKYWYLSTSKYKKKFIFYNRWLARIKITSNVYLKIENKFYKILGKNYIKDKLRFLVFRGELYMNINFKILHALEPLAYKTLVLKMVLFREVKNIKRWINRKLSLYYFVPLITLCYLLKYAGYCNVSKILNVIRFKISSISRLIGISPKIIVLKYYILSKLLIDKFSVVINSYLNQIILLLKNSFKLTLLICVETFVIMVPRKLLKGSFLTIKQIRKPFFLLRLNLNIYKTIYFLNIY